MYPLFHPQNFANIVSGGIRGLIQLEILRLIEKELDSKILIKAFFDIIVGKG
jgi:patatin-like phospholipase/acyl hydrolase